MNRNHKIGAAGVGLSAGLLAMALSLGGGADATRAAGAAVDQTAERDNGTESAASPRRRIVSGSQATREMEYIDEIALADLADLAALADRAAQPERPRPADLGTRPAPIGATSGVDGSPTPQEDDDDAITVTVPRRVTVVPPRYEPGRLPSVTPPSYEPGRDPSVSTEGSRVVVDRGDPGSVSKPSMREGRPSRLTPPEVVVE